VLATALYGLALPILALYSIVRDVVRGRPGFLLLRFHLYIFATLFIQILALLFLLGSYLYTLFMTPERRRIAHRNTEIFFIPKTIAIAERIYGMTIVLDNIECCAPGPILLLSRHASVLDTIMPIKLLGQALGMGMRIVQKSELMWNPVVDVASHRMPRAFIKRGSGDIDSQIGHMKHLLQGIDETDALVVFPEGSRFSEEKKARIIDKLAQSNPIAADRARRLRAVLPIRPAGTTALIDARPDMDVVFLAHTGLEGANKLEDFVAGALYKQKVHMKFWRVAAHDIPKDPDERIAWLHEEWSKVDQWICENRA
jgi:1-acyl-sn-glycerol-3-phosphate acyltransferase